MRGKILFVAGLAAGYVIGARAGRPAYEAITERLSGARENPTVQRIGGAAKSKLEEKAPKVAEAAEQVASTVQDAAASASEAGSPADAAEDGKQEATKQDAAPPDDAKPGDADPTDAKPADAATPGVETDGATDAPVPTPPSRRARSSAPRTPTAPEA